MGCDVVKPGRKFLKFLTPVSLLGPAVSFFLSEIRVTSTPFCPEDGGNYFLRDVSNNLSVCTVSHPKML
jgi:hypothetical protein